ncbi:MAG: hypothetical protein IKM42_06000, partial [Clostridia bacterium]|nr:hypothetical protein [Clostridia bacterium]
FEYLLAYHNLQMHRRRSLKYVHKLQRFARGSMPGVPTWMAPEQVRILPIGDEHIDYAYDVKRKLAAKGVRVEVDDRNETIGKKIRTTQLEKVPYMLVIGDNEMNAGTVAVRSRKEGDKGAVTVDEFLSDLLVEIEEKRR